MAQSDFVGRGQELVTSGQYQEAVKVCRLGLLARPSEVNGRLVLASALLALRRYDEVLAEMRVASELEPGNAGAHQLRGEALLRKGDPHAAVDALERAKKLAGGDPTISALLEEARLARTAAGPPSFGDADSMTKHYPTHRGDGASGSARSVSVTRPRDKSATRDRALTPPPDELRIGDSSGTVELDPEMEGVELDDDDLVEQPSTDGTGTLAVDDADLEEVDDDPPRRAEEQTRAGRPKSGRTPAPEAEVGRGRGGMRASAQQTAQWGAEEVSENQTRRKVLPVPPRDEDAATAPRPFVDELSGPRAPLDPRLARSAKAAADMFPEESSLSGRQSKPELANLTSGPLGGLTPAPVMTPSGRFLSAPSGPGAAMGGRGEAPSQPPMKPTFGPPSVAVQPYPSGPVPGFPTNALQVAPPHAATVAGGLSPGAIAPTVTGGVGPAGTPPGMHETPSGRLVPAVQPHAATMVPFTAAAVRPTMAMSAAEVPPAPTGGDMDVIRAGLNHPPPEYQSFSSPNPAMFITPPPPERPRNPPTRTSRLALRSPAMLAVWIAITLAIIGGGVFAGFKIRDARLAKQIAAARRGADAVARTDTWSGWRGARDRLAAIIRARGSQGNRAALARVRAVLAAVYLDDLDGAKAAVAELGNERGRDAALARAYLAIAQGDGKGATEALAGAGAVDADPELALVVARAAAVDGRWDAAAVAARRATEQDARAGAFITLCEIETARQRYNEAERACGDAERLVPGNPGAIIARARLHAASGAARNETAKLVAELEALNVEAARPAAEQRLGVSPGQAVWAQLALAEVGLAAGDPQAARRAAERAQGNQISSRALAEAQAAIALRLGDVAAAGRLAEQGLGRWSGSVALTAVRARALLAGGDVDGADAAIGKLPSGADSVELAILRGEIAIARGDVDGAAKLLDGALANRPDDVDALVARAEIDLLRNDPRAAMTRIEGRYSKQAPPGLTITYAAAQRQLKRFDEARVALGRITSTSAPGPITGRAWFELARVERDSGNAKEARDAYGKAQEMLPASRDVRLEAAVLSIDDGDATGGRDALKGLLADKQGDGVTLVETARALIFTGDLTGAAALLDEAAATTTAPKARLGRERGRLALRRRDVKAAIAALVQSVADDELDLEARLLLIDAYLVAGQTADVNRVGEDIIRKFPGRPELRLVTGRTALAAQPPRTAEARTEFGAAKTLLTKAPRRILADACYWLGSAYYFSDDLPSARTQLLEAIKLEPTNADAHGALGLVYSELQDWANAARILQTAVQLDPENADAYFTLGTALQNLKRTKEARAAFEQYLKRAPTGEHADDARAALAK